MSAHVHDVLGVGIGPFNLGLACLADPLDLDAVFVDQAPEFRWHPGMMIDGATIQVPFLADLVTMADPTSPYSFLAYLKDVGRLYPFYIRESFYPLRAEYDAYCRWAAARLGSLRWGRQVVSLERDADTWVARAELADGTVETYRARHVVLGTGTSPVLPPALRDLGDSAVHSAQYLARRTVLLAAGHVTVVGSGQSAAEIYRDLLGELRTPHGGGPLDRLDWVTRSPRFFPMEYTKLTLEMTSPEYTDHFHALPLELRDRLGREQRGLYKGISGDLVDDIYDTLYRLSLEHRVPTTLLTDTEVVAASTDVDGIELRLHHAQLDRGTTHRTRAVVVATGYAAAEPAFLGPVRDLLDRDARGRLAVTRDYTVEPSRTLHVQNAEEHTHGLTAPDLGMGAWRNAVILSTILGHEPYPVERRIAFQQFGLPDGGAR
ncbi:lysine N6-hydroxylase [Sediminihabitans luteus]|uniref:L-lysine N6-monooxygenase MbtG n=1 Tax=Sediminihabitans luteus TaxID=1138585 RepID=A0A2M9CR13_9CELL|nr:SidA/IucD/PvdA family monooxygenase [Sediminihabitans luteus]PJJ74281.1 lysine N6-hydroxylase [Sediminihabitans luteus]GII99134.1 monooxygenase [Sediminihabitans luteus]